MITRDLTAYQNATLRELFIVYSTQVACTMAVDSTIITAPCHGLVAGDVVGFTALAGTLPCGLDAGLTYYVIGTGLTHSQFSVSATLGGTALDLKVSAANLTGGMYAVGKRKDLTGWTLDADVRSAYGGSLLATMTCTITDQVNGRFQLVMSDTVTGGLAAGSYLWDLNARQSGGDSEYWMSGAFIVAPTVSRASG